MNRLFPDRYALCSAAAAALMLVCSAPGTTVHAQQVDGKTCNGDMQSGIVDVADDASAHLRLRQLQGNAPLTALTVRRPSLDRQRARCVSAADSTSRTFQLSLLPVRLRTIYNSAYPVDVNNGAMWSGRGVTSAVSAGLEVRAGAFSAALYPLAVHHENREFQLALGSTGRSPFAYAWHIIDWPQRHGPTPFWTFDPGQSYLRAEAFGLTAGISTENLWLGPAQRMPILMGSSAPGFPHVFLATAQPLDIRIGRIDMQLFSARLTESPYFDGDDSNDHLMLAGLSAVFEPSFARGLFLGANRMYLARGDTLSVRRYVVEPFIDVRGNPRGQNQLMSLYARWAFPAVGFEVYGEWGREDAWGTWYDLLMEPDHAQVYMLGFQKSGNWRGAALRWYGELAHLQSALPLRGGRGVITMYTHGELLQGFTHRGQLLGAWIGPGSDAQLLGVERTTARRTSGVMIERVRSDDNAYYNVWAPFYGHSGHDVSLGTTLRHVEAYGPFRVGAALGVARRHNRNFVHFTGAQPGDFRAETNVQLDLDIQWLPRR
ncbi:MAG TPA: capsule assembly Wzi family protein [Longimicrobiales bacterium]|nr:capsule assembly Wzi family protein [Longimicrobiales bacterium]